MLQLIYELRKNVADLKKKSQKADRHVGGEEGGSTLTVSLTVKYPFFLTTSLKSKPKNLLGAI